MMRRTSCDFPHWSQFIVLLIDHYCNGGWRLQSQISGALSFDDKTVDAILANSRHFRGKPPWWIWYRMMRAGLARRYISNGQIPSHRCLRDQILKRYRKRPHLGGLAIRFSRQLSQKVQAGSLVSVSNSTLWGKFQTGSFSSALAFESIVVYW